MVPLTFKYFIHRYNASVQESTETAYLLPAYAAIFFSKISTTSQADFAPYFTKIGFYNQNRELIMVAHMSNPVKIHSENDLVEETDKYILEIEISFVNASSYWI